VKGNKTSTSFLLPDSAAISMGLLPTCHITKEQNEIASPSKDFHANDMILTFKFPQKGEKVAWNLCK